MLLIVLCMFILTCSLGLLLVDSERFLRESCSADSVDHASVVQHDPSTLDCRIVECKQGFRLWDGKCVRHCLPTDVERATEVVEKNGECLVVACQGEKNVSNGEGWWPAQDRKSCVHMRSGEECGDISDPVYRYAFNGTKQCVVAGCKAPKYWKDKGCVEAGESCGENSVWRYNASRTELECGCDDGFGGDNCYPTPTWIRQYNDPKCPAAYTVACLVGKELSEACTDPPATIENPSCDRCRLTVVIHLKRTTAETKTIVLTLTSTPVDIELLFYGRRPLPNERFLVTEAMVPPGVVLRLFERGSVVGEYKRTEYIANELITEYPQDGLSTERFQLFTLSRIRDTIP